MLVGASDLQSLQLKIFSNIDLCSLSAKLFLRTTAPVEPPQVRQSSALLQTTHQSISMYSTLAPNQYSFIKYRSQSLKDLILLRFY